MHKKGTQFEKIGGVTLDYTLYPGEDFYSDGEIENELLSSTEAFSLFWYVRVWYEAKCASETAEHSQLFPRPCATQGGHYIGNAERL